MTGRRGVPAESDRPRSCPTGKMQFRSEWRAQRNLSRIWRRPKPGRRLEIRPYQCPHCRYWHLTSQEAR